MGARQGPRQGACLGSSLPERSKFNGLRGTTPASRREMTRRMAWHRRAACERRPVLGAGAVAGRLATGVLVEGTKGHALGIDKVLALWRVGRLQRPRRRR